MTKIYILIEQALGYCLLKVKHCKSFDDLQVLLQDKFFENIKGKIKLAEFQPFSSVNNASMNCQDIANGLANVDLISLLKRHLCEGRCLLVVGDRKLLESLKSANINDLLEFNGDSAMIIHLRRVRFSIHEFMGDDEKHLRRAHIGLGHSFSRMKIKYNVNRADNMIIQTINLMDQLDKDINTMSMRLREWFGYHYPELIKLVSDNRAYGMVVEIIGSRAGAIDDVLEKLEDAVGDSSRAKQIILNARTSMGYELTEEDFFNIGHLAKKTLSMMTQREDLAKYLASKMSQVAPNFSTLVGDIVAARLISHAGSLINLAKFPASTIQILGAEKALFRALKTRTNTPKYGLIFHSSFISRAGKNDKGRISRYLAAKISLSVRLDCFMEEPMNIYGIHLKKQVEDQLKYLETGEEPKKNFEAMEEAVKEAKRYISELTVSRNETGPNNKCNEEMTVDTENIEVINESKQKKKKKRKIDVEEKIMTVPENVSDQSNKKRKQKAEIEDVKVDVLEIGEKTKKNKKKNKKKKGVNALVAENESKMVSVDDNTEEETGRQIPKRNKNEIECEANIENGDGDLKMKKKKKKKDILLEEAVVETVSKKDKKRSLSLVEHVPVVDGPSIKRTKKNKSLNEDELRTEEVASAAIKKKKKN